MGTRAPRPGVASWGRPSTALLPALAVALLLTGCASSKDAPTAPTSGQQASPRSSPSSSPTAGSSPAATPSLEDSPCRVTGFRPGKQVVLRSQRRTLLYAAGLALGPGVGARGAARLQLTTDVHPGVRVVSPSGASVDPAVLAAVGATVKSSSPAPLPGEFFARRRVLNSTRETRTYAEYVAAKVYRGSWSTRVCGGLTNDGTTVTVVRGSFTTIGLTDSGVIPCERVTGQRPEWVRRLAVVCE